MLKLFKYEMRKTLMVKLIVFGLAIVLQGWFMYGVLSSKPGTAAIGGICLFIEAVIGTLFIGVSSVTTLHRDMNTKQSYMLFMTPNSNYAILGAKALEFMVSLFIALVVFLGGVYGDYCWLNSRFGEVEQVREFLDELVKSMPIQVTITVPMIISEVVRTAASWFGTIMIAFLADVLATSIMKGKKFGMLLTFIFFIALTVVSNWIVGKIPTITNMALDTVVRVAVDLVIAGVVYVATATIMEKKLSV